MGNYWTKASAVMRIVDVQKKSNGVLLRRFNLSEIPSTPINILLDTSGKTYIEVKMNEDEFSWYVDYITIETRENQYIFPVFRGLDPGCTYTFRHSQQDACLPQKDVDQSERKKDLEEKRQTYEISMSQPLMPAQNYSINMTPQVLTLPSEETFSWLYKLELKKHFDEDEFVEEEDILWEKLFRSEWTTLDDVCKYIYGGQVYFEPMSKQHWREDWFFGQQRLAGVCPTLISLCKDELPSMLSDNLSHGTGRKLEQEHLEGKTIAMALDENRLFYCDLKILDILKDINAKRKLVVCTPILLLCKNSADVLLPVAIQLFQEPGPNNPVFLPSDGTNIWILIKMWYNQAETAYHESIAHLGFTHMIMESVSLNVHRQLSFHHPIFKLIAPHLLYIMMINRFSSTLLHRGGWIDNTMYCGRDGTIALIQEKMKDWQLEVDGTLPNDMDRRGVKDPDVLPGYHYRDDAMQLYDVIKACVTRYVEYYYRTEEELQGDWEIQAFAKELMASRDEGGMGVKGVPGNGRFSERSQLIQTLTSCIFTCSVQHAAVNFGQYDYYGFFPCYSSMLMGSPPSKTEEVMEEDLLKTIPSKMTVLETMKMTRLLSSGGGKSLGDFEVNYIFDDQATNIVTRFREDLMIVGGRIQGQLQYRNPPYNYLLPDKIPNSISI